MEQKKRLFNDIVRTMALVLDYDEGLKLNHAIRVGVLSSWIAEEMDVDDCALAYYGGLLHDIGAIGLEDHIIHHAEKGFTDKEARRHPEKGASILKPFNLFKPIISFIQHHHEHFDGSGFPAGLKGDDIPVEAGILLAADILDIHLRDEAEEKRYIKALDVLKEQSGKMISPDVAEASIAVIRNQSHVMVSLFEDNALNKAAVQVDAVPPGIDKMSRMEMLNQLLWMLARLIDIKSACLLGHSTRTAFFALKIAQAFGKEEVNGWDVLCAGLTHDIGMVCIPRAVLTQSSNLDAVEEEIFQQHPRHTLNILSGIRDLSYLSYPAGSHHENYDGSGYPFGTSHEDIPLIGRILAFADDYDRLTKNEPHTISHKEAIEKIKQACGSRFDPHIADIALPVLENYGINIENVLPEAETFHQAFRFDDADINKLLNQEIDSHSIFAPNGEGLSRQNIYQWQNATVSMDFVIQRGLQKLRQNLLPVDSDNFLDYIHNDDQEAFVQTVSALASWESVSKNLLTPRGEPFEMIATQKADSFDLLFRRIEREMKHIKKTSLLYRNFLTSSEAVIFTDPSGKIIDINHMVTELFGYSLEEVVHQHPDMLTVDGPDAKRFKRIFIVLNTGEKETWNDEMVFHTKDKVEIVMLLTINSIVDSTGLLTGYICHGTDITLRKKYEAALVEKDRQLERQNIELKKLTRLKSDLMAVASHDLKSPLNAMMSYADLLGLHINAAGFSKDKVEEYIRRMITSGRKLIGFINAVLDTHKIESGKVHLDLSPCHLETVLKECIDTHLVLAQIKEVNLNLKVDGDPTPINVDADKMAQVFNNLISNAIKFSPDREDIEITYTQDGSGKHFVKIYDRGPGIPEADLESIFEQYYQVKKQGSVPKRGVGTGLGLYIAKAVVMFHQGHIRAENRSGGGCCFIVELTSNDN